MFRVTTFDCVASTNNLVKRALENREGEGYAVCARRQTGGYGRQGRTWSSPEGGLYLSILLRPSVPPDKLSTLSLVMAAGVMRACEHACARNYGREPEADRGRECEYGRARKCTKHPFLLKWPNDVVVLESPCENDGVTPHERAQEPLCEGGQELPRENVQGALREQTPFQKLCGISLETHAGGVCVGIGVNVFEQSRELTNDGRCEGVRESGACEGAHEGGAHEDDERVEDGEKENIGVRPHKTRKKNTPAYLADFGFAGTLDELCADVLREVEIAYKEWACHGLSGFLEEWASRDALAGRAVTLVDRSGVPVAQGCVQGIDEAGRLLMRLSDGSRFAASSGEVHIV